MTALPSFYSPAQVPQLYIERAGEVTAAAEAHARAQRITPAGEDRLRIAAFGIDVQIGFCTPSASLFVPGAVQDTTRAVEWIYRNVGRITSLIFSLDTHRVFQIFHPAFWRDAGGNHPAPMTPIRSADVESGRWIPTRTSRAVALEYTRQLETSGKYVLTIWPYHTLLGGLSHALVPAMMEASLFHAAARSQPTYFEVKGNSELTENYSVLSPEVTEVGGQAVGAFNHTLFQRLLSHDRVYVFGQAKSHCVLSTLQDLRRQIERTDRSLMSRIVILEDAMSPVPAPRLDPLPPGLDFPRLAEEGIAELKAAGMRVAKTTDPLDA